MSTTAVDLIPTRHTLLVRLKDWGDQTSWQEFFDTYGRLIYNVAVKAGLTDVEAQEVVQETVIAVARNIGEFKAGPQHGSFSAWLMQLTRWRIADQRRKRVRSGLQSPASLRIPSRMRAESGTNTGTTGTIERLDDPAGLPLEQVWQEEWKDHLMISALAAVRRQVSPAQYQIFDLHCLQGLSVQETARTVQASVASVYMAKYRVGRLLKKEIGRLKPEPG